jgi:hypothetical protein
MSFARTPRALHTNVVVFQESIGRRVIGERRVATFRGRTRSFTWNGRANGGGHAPRDGVLLVQFRTQTPSGLGVRNLLLRRRHGRYASLSAYTKRKACSLLRTFSLTRPVFGGSTSRRLGVTVRVRHASRIRLTLRRGGHVVRTLSSRRLRAGQRVRLYVRPRGLAVAAYAVTLDVTSGSRRGSAVISSRRL